MKSRTTRRFREAFRALPSRVQVQAREAYRLFQQDPAHPGLRFKPVGKRSGAYSVRVGLAHRALGVMDGDTITWFWIGSHADYDRILRQL